MEHSLPPEDPDTVVVLLVGDEKCGKSTFLSRLSAGPQSTSAAMLRDMDQPFIFEIKIKKRPYRLEFYDTSSPENWRLLTPDLIVICYDISQRLSLINMQRFWMREIKDAYQKRIDGLPVVILGLKRDLRSDVDPNGIILPQEGLQHAQAMRADKYVECSAISGELLALAFEEICNTAAATRKGQGGGMSSGSCVPQ